MLVEDRCTPLSAELPRGGAREPEHETANRVHRESAGSGQVLPATPAAVAPIQHGAQVTDLVGDGCIDVRLVHRGAAWTGAEWAAAVMRLPDAERLRLATLRRWQDRQDSAAGWLLLSSLATGFGAQVWRGSNGRPYATAPVDVSLAHAGGWIVAAVHRGGRVGIDLEVDRPIPLALARRCLSARELNEVTAAIHAPGGGTAARAGAAATVDVSRFLRLWTAKEAYLKAIGTGLAADPRDVEVQLTGARPRLLEATGEAWCLRATSPGPGLYVTVCRERRR